MTQIITGASHNSHSHHAHLQVVSGSLSASVAGAFVMSSEALIFIETNSDFTMYPVTLPGITLQPGSRLAVDVSSGLLTLVATPTAVFEVECSVGDGSVTCSTVNSAAGAFGNVTDMAVVSNGGLSVAGYLATVAGGFMYQPGKALVLLQAEPPTAVAYFAAKSLLAFGSNESLMLYVNNTLTRRDWATDIVTGSGGVYDGPITSLAFDTYGWLFVGTTACVNILFPNNTVNHLSRFQGLPYNVTTSVSIEYNTRESTIFLIAYSHSLH